MSSRGICGALSEAVARAARERSEQERETPRCTARRHDLPAHVLRLAAVLTAAAFFAAACGTARPGVDTAEPELRAAEAPPEVAAAEASVEERAKSEKPSTDGEESAVGDSSTGAGSDDAVAGDEEGDVAAAGDGAASGDVAVVGDGSAADGGSSDSSAIAVDSKTLGIKGVDCPFELVGLGLTCSLATVPIDRDDPSSGTIDISVAVRPGTGDDSLPPLAVLQGGPGGASSDLAFILPTRPYAQVLIDQRGTGFGSVDFTCFEFVDILPELLEATRQQALPMEREAYGRCSDRLAANPALLHTTTAALAADVVDVMDALGHDQWLVYGVSYGTTIALEVLRDPPAGLMGAVLDGVFPSTLDLDVDTAFAAERVLAELDAVCAADPACTAILAEAPAGEGGSLSELLSDVIDSINALPTVISLSASETTVGEPLDVWIDGDAVASVVFQMLYADYLAALVPAVLAGLATGEGPGGGLLALVGVELAADSAANAAFGTLLAITCSERLPFTSGPPEDMGDFAAAVLGDGVAEGCESWTVHPPSLPAVAPVESDLPVLLVSGRFDPITPPEFADMAAENLPAATHIVSSVRGHGIWVWNLDGCIDRIVADFLNDPGTPLDTSCALQERPLRWQPLR